jgi:four helix bundle protein
VVRFQVAGISKQENSIIMAVRSAKELKVYQLAYQLSMEIFRVSKDFPAEEKYALISQIRRSSRSVSMNLREAWAKRRYEAHFISKLTDCDGENAETDTSLDFAFDCGYITKEQHTNLTEQNREVGKMLGSMLNNPKQWLLTPDS